MKYFLLIFALYALGCGKYDSPECYTKDGYRDFGICEYALDFEEYTLSLSPNNIFVIKGDATDNTFTFYDIVLSQTEQEYFLDVTATIGDLSEWITHDNQSIKFYKALNELQGHEKRQFIKQYSQSYMNGEIDNTDVWGYLINETGPIFVRNFFYKCNVCRGIGCFMVG